MAFMLGNNLTFIDSFQFMSSSLDKLVSNMRKEDLKYTSMAFYGYKLDLMSKKGIYPYDFMDSMEKFENKELPKIEDFYSMLNEEHINNKKRSHTQLDSRKQVIAFQDRVITVNIKEAQHPLKREKQVIDKSSIMLKISTKSMHRVLV